MTTTIIITFCALLLIAYVFDFTSSKTKIPSVILLLLLGWVVKQFTTWFQIQLPDFSPLLPILGTIGLILIVLEGSLELELNKSKLGIIRKSFLGALLPMVALACILAYGFNYIGHFRLHDCFTSVIPFCVISSAIAIPSVRSLSAYNKEFVIYESSLSEIIGVLIFNFFVLNEFITNDSFIHFGLQLLLISVVSFVATIGLSFLLNKIEHHIKFIPIVLLVILIYSVAKYYHLPGMIFVLFFGLAIGNLDELKQYKWIDRFKPEELNKEVIKFRELIIEGAFLVRAVFFLLFGFLIETSEVLNLETLPWACVIVFFIILFRALQLKLSKLPAKPLLFIAPRGLITILLFLSIEPEHLIPFVNKSLIIQVVILTTLLMMIGIMSHSTAKQVDDENDKSEDASALNSIH